MFITLNVELGARSYPILVGSGLLSRRDLLEPRLVTRVEGRLVGVDDLRVLGSQEELECPVDAGRLQVHTDCEPGPCLGPYQRV